MANSEEIEKVRQEIMRLRELLTVMRERLESGEQAYDRLFAKYLPEETSILKQKDRQWKLAESIVGDLSPLRQAVSRLQFDARQLEQGFAELHDIVASTPKPDPKPE